eukprot:scaffold8966_cov132-Isochrysis_galbana.AAC.4
MRLTVSLSLSLLVLCAAQTENVALPAVLPKKTGGKGGGKSGGKGVIGKQEWQDQGQWRHQQRESAGRGQDARALA